MGATCNDTPVLIATIPNGVNILARGHYLAVFFFSSRRRHTRSTRDWSSDVCYSDLNPAASTRPSKVESRQLSQSNSSRPWTSLKDRKSTRLNSSHEWISYAVFCL